MKAGNGEERRVDLENSAASGEWQWGDRKGQAATLGCGAALHYNHVGAGVAVQSLWSTLGRRVGLRMDAGTAAIREECESGDFLFLFLCG
jgi:hypothetical protein